MNLSELNIDEKWLEPLKETFEKFEIDTIEKQASFIGQCAHESAHFKVLQENLNYSAQGLANTWPSRFSIDQKSNPKVPNEKANTLARKPEGIANSVYANRMGNGDEQSGEGHKYRGRGLIQLTGKDNYTACGLALGIDIVQNPDLLLEPKYACLSAGWYWNKNGLNALAGNIEAITKKINGGLIGLEDRRLLTQNAMLALYA
jgi:putative chitinase